jgi:phosphonate degradation associated HDIG domain protein
MTASEFLDRTLGLFAERGGAAYFGEEVSQTEHALQTAAAAERSGAGPALVAAALLHDFGPLLHHLDEGRVSFTLDDHHEGLGSRWLQRFFGPDVTEPVRLHVPAKRYLCATEPGYLGLLTPASLASLRLQGGAMTPAEADAFHRIPYAEAAVSVRRWDDVAKVPGSATPGLDHFRPHLEAAVARRD